MADEQVLDAVWVRLVEAFGQQVVNNYGEEMPETWRMALLPMTEAQIKKGLEDAVTTGRTWMPTLSQFVAACRRARPAYHNPFPELPPPPKDFDKAAPIIESCRQALREDKKLTAEERLALWERSRGG